MPSPERASRTPRPRASDRLVVALDTPSAAEAFALADRVRPVTRFVKIGIGDLGRDAVGMGRRLRQQGFRVFLDLKLFDIASTVQRAVAGVIEAAEPDLLTVHGDPRVVAAARAAREGAATRILAITLLTSLTRRELDGMLLAPGPVPALLRERGRRALEAGADGLVAAPPDLPVLRDLPACRGRLLVTPGIRPAGPACSGDDQARTATPAEAWRLGADHIVVGRPILAAADPARAARDILAAATPAAGAD